MTYEATTTKRQIANHINTLRCEYEQAVAQYDLQLRAVDIATTWGLDDEVQLALQAAAEWSAYANAINHEARFWIDALSTRVHAA